MSNYYQILNVNKNATLKQIKKAYKRLVLTCHPDKVTGKEAQFHALQEAYLTLSDIDKRRAYDEELLKPKAVSRTATSKTSLNFFLSETPNDDDHYTYYNKLLGLTDGEKIRPGQSFDKDQAGYLYVQIERVSVILHREYHALEAKKDSLYFSSKKLSEVEQKRFNLIYANIRKIGVELNRFALTRPHKIVSTNQSSD